jgi:membrane protease YdiL (CAAX protease family)
MKKAALWLEFFLLYIGIPLLMMANSTRVGHLAMIVLLLIAVLMLYGLLRDQRFDRSNLLRLDNVRQWLWRIARLFLVFSLPLTLFTWYFHPELLLRFPTRHPGLWLTIMLLYPLLSAYPQEIIYRAWLFHRYRELVPDEGLRVLLSAAVFGFAHVFFGNWIAILLSTIGGFIFAHTYLRSRSLFITTLEHGLWGDFLFTVGLGSYLFTGNIT